MEWNEFFLKIAETISIKSKDNSTKVGCVIVGPDHEIRSSGWNGFPRGIYDKKIEMDYKNLEFKFIKRKRFCQQDILDINNRIIKKNERPLKYKWTEHAERNAIYNAARIGIGLNDCIIYIHGLPPCTDCSRAIIQVGIKEVIYKCVRKIPERWMEDLNIAKEMLEEANIQIKEIK